MSDKWTAADLPSLDGRTIVVTGANSGIGKVAARELARAGARVTLAVRDTTKGEAAAAEMTGDVGVRELDLSDLSSVRAFAEAWEGDLDVLINNAGVMATPLTRTKDGFELQIGTNHLGHFALTNLLLPRITERVVTVSSGAHRTGKIDLDDLNWEQRDYQRWRAYGQSKLGLTLFTNELARRVDGSGLTANSLHPGVMASNLGRRGGVVGVVWAVASCFMSSPRAAARYVTYLASSPRVAETNGAYFDQARRILGLVEVLPNAPEAVGDVLARICGSDRHLA